jgi:ribosomal small subunit protein bTHX
MGKGDKRTRRGKIFASSFGKSRPKPKVKKAQAADNKKEQKEA